MVGTQTPQGPIAGPAPHAFAPCFRLGWSRRELAGAIAAHAGPGDGHAGVATVSARAPAQP
eukprot:3788574-Lingulodinium_polyedra.AAC.1